MLLEEYRTSLRVRPKNLGDVLRHGEAWPLVVEPDGFAPERIPDELPSVGRGRERDDRVGVRVVDVRGVDERVEQRLDRRPRLVGHERAAAEVVDHLRVVHRVAFDEWEDLVEPKGGETGGGDGGQVGA